MADLSRAIVRVLSRIIVRTIDRTSSDGSAAAAATFHLLAESGSVLDTEASGQLRTE